MRLLVTTDPTVILVMVMPCHAMHVYELHFATALSHSANSGEHYCNSDPASSCKQASFVFSFLQKLTNMRNRM